VVRVELRFAGEGVEAEVQASSDVAQELLTERLDDLRAALESRGLEVHRLTVSREPWEGGGSSAQARDGRGSESLADRGPGTGGGSDDGGAGGSARDGAGGSGGHAERGPWDGMVEVPEDPGVLGSDGFAAWPGRGLSSWTSVIRLNVVA